MFTSVWYPDRYDKMMGLFIRKHAAAVSRLNDVCVVYTRPDSNVSFLSPLHLETNRYGNVNEYLLYYHSCNIPFIRIFINFVFFTAAVLKLLHVVFTNEGRPDVTHVNVLTRWGTVAYLMKLVYGIPYVVTEHWTRYLPQTNAYKGFIRKRITELVVKNASKVMPVSKLLKDSMEHCNLHGDYEVVENVVDDFFYTPAVPSADSKTVILHVSCFHDEAKNVSGIIEAVALLKEKRDDFKVVLVGTGVEFDSIVGKARSMDLLDVVEFTGEQTPQQVKQWMDKSDFFLLFSNFETAGVVLQETIACGKPWVSSNVGVASEDSEHKYGVTVEPGDVKGLCDKIDWMIDHHRDYDADELRKSAAKYSFDCISRKLDNIYNEVVD